MGKSSAHIIGGARGFIFHNSRENYSKSQVFFDQKNEVDHTAKEALEIFDRELAARSKKYQERTGQRLQKNVVTQLSMVVNLEAHHTLDDLKKIGDFLERRLGTKVFQMAIHRDEGKLVNKETGEILTSGEHFFGNKKDGKLYYDQAYTKPIDMTKYEIEINNHGHFEFLGLDENGASIRRALHTRFLRELQDYVAETLQMERGERVQPTYTTDQMKEIKKALGSKKDYPNDKAYGEAFTKMAKELGYWKPKPKKKRLSTHDFKKQKAIENEERAKALAKIKDITEENKVLRAKLKEQGASREEYAELEKLVRELKEQARAKDLTIEDLKTQIEAFKTQKATQDHTITQKDAQIAKLEAENEDLKETKKSYEDMMSNLVDENKELKEENSRLEKLVKDLKDKVIDYGNRLTEYMKIVAKGKEKQSPLQGISKDEVMEIAKRVKKRKTLTLDDFRINKKNQFETTIEIRDGNDWRPANEAELNQFDKLNETKAKEEIERKKQMNEERGQKRRGYDIGGR